MKKKIILTLVVFLFMTIMSFMLIPKTYAQAGFTRDAWNKEICDGEENPVYSITKENAIVETSGYSPEGYFSPFMLTSNKYSSDDSYVISAVFKGTEDVAPESVEGGIVKMGIVPFYKDSGNFFVVYFNWENSISTDKLANVHLNGQVNGQWVDQDIIWIHDNSNSDFNDLKVASNHDEGFKLEVRVYSNRIDVVIFCTDGSYLVGTYQTDFDLTAGDSCCGLYAYGTSCQVNDFTINSNVANIKYVIDEEQGLYINDYYPIGSGMDYVIRDLEHPLGYDLVQWYEVSDEVFYSIGDSPYIYRDMIFYPEWQEPEVATIIFNANGGEGSMDPQEVFVGEITELKACKFIRDGYVFDKWGINTMGTITTFENGGSITLNTASSTTLYALWRRIEVDETTIKEYVETNGYYSETEYLEYGRVNYENGIAYGQNSVDITVDNNQAILDYITNNNYHSDNEYLSYGETKYQEGVNSVDITSDNQSSIDSYITENNYHSDNEYLEYGQTKYEEGYTLGAESVDITLDNQTAIDDFISGNNYYSEDEYLEYGQTKYEEGYTLGAESVDTLSHYDKGWYDGWNSGNITGNNQGYQNGYQNGYEEGYTAGVESIDITSDNQTVIDDYITANNYHSNTEYLKYGESKYQDGYTVGTTQANEENEVHIENLNKEHTQEMNKLKELHAQALLEKYNQGQDAGYQSGYNIGYQEGYQTGLIESEGYTAGYEIGYSEGYTAGENNNKPVSFWQKISNFFNKIFDAIEKAFS